MISISHVNIDMAACSFLCKLFSQFESYLPETQTTRAPISYNSSHRNNRSKIHYFIKTFVFFKILKLVIYSIFYPVQHILAKSFPNRTIISYRSIGKIGYKMCFFKANFSAITSFSKLRENPNANP